MSTFDIIYIKNVYETMKDRRRALQILPWYKDGFLKYINPLQWYLLWYITVLFLSFPELNGVENFI
jgi:hypothetical protein